MVDDLIEPERRKGLARVPFVRRCEVGFGGRSRPGYVININVLGAYLSPDDGAAPDVGGGVRCRFGSPHRDLAIEIPGVVSWVNARQQHPVHGLPPGFGIKFDSLPPDVLGAIEEIVEDYLRRHS